jgi:hypothetical protein
MRKFIALALLALNTQAAEPNSAPAKDVSGKEPSAKEVSGKEPSAKEVSGKELSAKEVSGKERSSGDMSISIHGNQELPTVMHIVPWQEAGDNKIIQEVNKPPLADLFPQIERSEHQREVRYLLNSEQTQTQ